MLNVIGAHSVPVFFGCMESGHADDDWLTLKSTDSYLTGHGFLGMKSLAVAIDKVISCLNGKEYGPALSKHGTITYANIQ